MRRSLLDAQHSGANNAMRQGGWDDGSLPRGHTDRSLPHGLSAGEGDGGPSGSQPQRGNASRCRLGTRFSRFEVRAEYLQAEHFKQHAESSAHRTAVAAWLNPDASLRFAAQETLEDEQLFAGAVPQPIDWLRTWRAATTPQSWQAAARNLDTEHYAHMLRPRSVEPRALQRMARIQAEVVRTTFREWIFEATSITLMFDDRNGYKLVLFRCDAHPPSCSAGSWQPITDGIAARSGCIGIAEMLAGATMEDLAKDYAERVVEELKLMCARFCTLWQRRLSQAAGRAYNGREGQRVNAEEGRRNMVTVVLRAYAEKRRLQYTDWA